MIAKTARCAVCGDEIRTGRYQDVTAGGVITNTYRAWGHTNGAVVTKQGITDRGSDEPVSHWAHPAGQPADGIVRAARVRIRMRTPRPV